MYELCALLIMLTSNHRGGKLIKETVFDETFLKIMNLADCYVLSY